MNVQLVVDLMQDGALVALGVAQIVNGLRLKSLDEDLRRDERVERVRSRFGRPVLLEEHAVEEERNRGAAWLVEDGLGVSSGGARHDGSGINPRLFRRGDSVKLDGMTGEYRLFDYDGCSFRASRTDDPQVSIGFQASQVSAWKHNDGEWPVSWVTRNAGGPAGFSNAMSDATEPASSISGTVSVSPRPSQESGHGGAGNGSAPTGSEV